AVIAFDGVHAGKPIPITNQKSARPAARLGDLQSMLQTAGQLGKGGVGTQIEGAAYTDLGTSSLCECGRYQQANCSQNDADFLKHDSDYPRTRDWRHTPNQSLRLLAPDLGSSPTRGNKMRISEA